MINKRIKGELIEFYTKDKCPLNGFLISKNNKKVIVMVHGMNSNFYGNISLKMSDILLKNGFDLFSINTRGHDRISAYRIKKGNKLKRVIAGTSFERFEDCKYDIKAAVGFLSSVGYKNIILLGHSTGCQKSIYYLLNYNKVKAVVFLGPGDDYYIFKKGLKRNFNILKKKVKKVKNKNRIFFDLYNNNDYSWSAQRFDSIVNRVEGRIFNYKLKNLREFKKIKIPILTVIGEKDDTFPLTIKKCIEILGKNTSSDNFNGIIIKNAGHNFKNHEIETANKIVSWLKGIRWQ